ncbi:MAG: hypothetical protein V4724_24445 [Pseudomonadota bacterium]
MASLAAALAAPRIEFIRIAGGFRRIMKTELGAEQLCACCNEPWPMDSEFFQVSSRGVSYECNACIRERARARATPRRRAAQAVAALLGNDPLSVTGHAAASG